MKVREVVYLGSYGCDQPLPDPVGPEFAFVGRSNVGKSSLINTLVGRRDIARTSNTPGKTRTANFYVVNGAFCFVDLPGYGYARVSKKERERWQRLIKVCVENRDVLGGVVHLLDVRHTPSTEDRATAAALRKVDVPVCVVFTKTDKVKTGQIDRRIAAHLGVLDLDSATAVVPFSAQSGTGKRPLWAWLRERLSL